MPRPFLLAAALLASLTACADPPADTLPEPGPEPEAEIISGDETVLFDGSSLDGWDGPNPMFRIEDGAIVAGTMDAPIERNEFLCTVETYDDFVLRLQFQLRGEGANAGVQFRTERIPDHHEVIGYQADMGDGWWGKLYDESRRNRVLAGPDSVPGLIRPNDWNDYEIRAEGPRVRLAINGVQTVDYVETDSTIVPEGRVCVQIHSGPPSEAWYRDIRIEAL